MLYNNKDIFILKE